MVDGIAERAGQLRRVRHAPITVVGGMAGTLANFWLAAPRRGLAGDDFRPAQMTRAGPLSGRLRLLRIARPRCGKAARFVVLGQDLVAEADAEVADIDVTGAGNQPHLTLLLATERATGDRAIHGPNYLRLPRHQSISLMATATARVIPLTAISSSKLAFRMLSMLPNWRSSARRRTGPSPVIPSSTETKASFLRTTRWRGREIRWARSGTAAPGRRPPHSTG